MSEPNAVMFVRNYLIERDEALAPGEADDDERMESAREIVEGVRKSLSASLPADGDGLVERLNGVYRIPITDGLGAVGSGEEPDNPNEFVRRFDTPPIQKEAASLIQSQAARIAELERERDGWFQATKNALEAGTIVPAPEPTRNAARALLNRRAEG